jgi:hypothetical protein
LGVTILAVVKTVFGGHWNAEGRTKAIALYIGAAAKRARIKFHVTHFPGSAMLADAAAGENIERLGESPLGFPPICAPAQFNAYRFKTQNRAFRQLSVTVRARPVTGSVKVG